MFVPTIVLVAFLGVIFWLTLMVFRLFQRIKRLKKIIHRLETGEEKDVNIDGFER